MGKRSAVDNSNIDARKRTRMHPSDTAPSKQGFDGVAYAQNSVAEPNGSQSEAVEDQPTKETGTISEDWDDIDTGDMYKKKHDVDTAGGSSKAVGDVPEVSGDADAEPEKKLVISQSDIAAAGDAAAVSVDRPSTKASHVVTVGANQAQISNPATTTLSVRSIVPSPVQVLVDDAEVSGYSDALKKRILIISNYVNAAANVYSVGCILPTATWGPYQPFNDKSKVLVNPATGEPVLLWIIGKITRTWFTKNGMADRQASVNLACLSESLSRQTARLLAAFSTPAQASVESGWADIRAVRWQSVRVRGVAQEPVLFDAVYDARDSLKAKSEMKSYPVTDLKARDLVLMEAKFTRYRTKDQSGQWNSRAQLEMEAISLLHSADYSEGGEDGSRPRDMGDLHTAMVPTKDDLSRAIQKVVMQDSAVGTQTIINRVITVHPDWTLTAKRIRRLRRNLPQPSTFVPELLPVLAVFLHPCDLSIIKGPEDIRAFIELVRGHRPLNDTEAVALLALYIDPDGMQAPIDFYPRQAHVTSIYYQAYFTNPLDDVRPINAIGRIVFPPGRIPRGPLFILMNGLDYDPESSMFDVDPEELSKTLWWYIGSGRSAIDVAKERRFEQYFTSLEL
ncbi:hypothetical protein BV22DRAFT_1051663 [Leucogyrophana mollusca]|uniref:Uncharacterized protein n=1 Tax=Leucogyrophana mollusca TaxID=85980 RepID=A0ACB8AZ60_9AGAM|nr:hypothetical protein BV22DRAFT_1051663 [Leucogyrophana mollusca]